LEARADRIAVDEPLWSVLRFGPGGLGRALKPAEVQFLALHDTAEAMARTLNFVHDDGALRADHRLKGIRKSGRQPLPEPPHPVLVMRGGGQEPRLRGRVELPHDLARHPHHQRPVRDLPPLGDQRAGPDQAARPIRAPLRIVAPMPIRLPSPMVQPCSITLWPMVQFAPTVSG
jgi:hypothetical protein